MWFGINGFSNLDSNNTDPIYIKRNKITGNVSELACYIGDDGTQALPYFPPTNESTPTDYFSIRATNTGNPHHSFSSTGNYYCGNNIYTTNNVNITKSLIGSSIHSSPNYSNTYNINYYSYPSPFRSNSGTYNEEFLIATYNVLAGNKIKLTYYFKYGTWFCGNNQSSFEGYYTFKITTFYVKV